MIYVLICCIEEQYLFIALYPELQYLRINLTKESIFVVFIRILDFTTSCVAF